MFSTNYLLKYVTNAHKALEHNHRNNNKEIKKAAILCTAGRTNAWNTPVQPAINCVYPSFRLWAGAVWECAVGGRELMPHLGGASAATAARPIIVLPAYA